MIVLWHVYIFFTAITYILSEINKFCKYKLKKTYIFFKQIEKTRCKTTKLYLFYVYFIDKRRSLLYNI